MSILLGITLRLKKLRKCALAKRLCRGQNLKVKTLFIMFWAKQLRDVTCFVLLFNFQIKMVFR